MLNNEHSKSLPLVCLISCVGQVEYTRTVITLETLAQCGFRVSAIAPGSLDGVKSAELIVHHAVPTPSTNFWYDAGFANTLRALWQRIKNSSFLVRKLIHVKPDIVICSEPDVWLIAVTLKRLLGFKVIADLREVYDDRSLAFPQLTQSYVRSALRVTMRWLSHFTDEIIHVSPERQQAYSYLSKPGVIIASYPDLHLFSSESELHENDSSEVGESLVRAIHVGALRPTYASNELLDAMTIAAESCSRLRFTVLGGVAGELRNKKTIDDLSARGLLNFVQQVPFTEVVRQLKESDIGINLVLPIDTAHYLAAPQKLYEYMAAGLPIVAADVPTIHRVVTESDCGILVEPSSPQQIAAALVQLAEDAELRATLGRNAAMAVKREYNWELQAQKLCVLVNSVAKWRPG